MGRELAQVWVMKVVLRRSTIFSEHFQAPRARKGLNIAGRGEATGWQGEAEREGNWLDGTERQVREGRHGKKLRSKKEE